MAEPFKDMLNRDLLLGIASRIQSVYSPFQADMFLDSIMDETWDGLGLKARVRKITLGMGKFLPADYAQAIFILDELAANVSGLPGLFLPDFVEVYGQEEKDWDLSIAALERYTVCCSAEFAVRWFIIHREERMMAQMYVWSKYDNEHLRRLSSEGCRPQLPWGQALVKFKEDPTPILPILEQLKSDPSLYVRKSVANNLNDISKTHPDLVVSIAKDWYGRSNDTDWIVRHGCRTLLKKGNKALLSLFGYQDDTPIDVHGPTLAADAIAIGEDVVFSFSVKSGEDTNVRLEYGVDFMKANGKHSRKIFQISKTALPANKEKPYTKRHSFADTSVRKHYPGTHSITLIVNGAERGTRDFELHKS